LKSETFTIIRLQRFPVSKGYFTAFTKPVCDGLHFKVSLESFSVLKGELVFCGRIFDSMASLEPQDADSIRSGSIRIKVSLPLKRVYKIFTFHCTHLFTSKDRKHSIRHFQFRSEDGTVQCCLINYNIAHFG
jgi:hypothetical protein